MENATDLRGLKLEERQDFRNGAGHAVTGDIGDGRTPKRLGSGRGIASESFCFVGPTIGLAMLVAGGRAVTSLSFVNPGRGPGVGNFIPEEGGRKGEVQLGLASTTVPPLDGFE